MVNYLKPTWEKAALALMVAFALAGVFFGGPVFAEPAAPQAVDADLSTDAQASVALQGTTVDHSQFAALQGPFETPQDVTKACISCHTDAADEVMHTTHWTWQFE